MKTCEFDSSVTNYDRAENNSAQNLVMASCNNIF